MFSVIIGVNKNQDGVPDAANDWKIKLCKKLIIQVFHFILIILTVYLKT